MDGGRTSNRWTLLVARVYHRLSRQRCSHGGLRMAYVVYPAGDLWHIAERRQDVVHGK